MRAVVDVATATLDAANKGYHDKCASRAGCAARTGSCFFFDIEKRQETKAREKPRKRKKKNNSVGPTDEHMANQHLVPGVFHRPGFGRSQARAILAA